MKRNMDFFGTPERKSTMPRVQCHVDGISISGVGSMRISNIPESLCKMANLLVILSQKASSILFCGFTLGAVRVKGDCLDPGNLKGYSNLYLNHTHQEAFLWIKYANAFDAKLPSECNFSVAEQQPGNYLFSGCACSSGLNIYNAFLYGQNMTLESINCIEQYLQCSTPFFGNVLGVTLGGLGLLLCVCTCLTSGRKIYQRFNKIYQRCNRRHEETPLLINPEPKLESLNPVIMDSEDENANRQQPQNNSWCCFRR
jgi:hypothetical protein